MKSDTSKALTEASVNNSSNDLSHTSKEKDAHVDLTGTSDNNGETVPVIQRLERAGNSAVAAGKYLGGPLSYDNQHKFLSTTMNRNMYCNDPYWHS